MNRASGTGTEDGQQVLTKQENYFCRGCVVCQVSIKKMEDTHSAELNANAECSPPGLWHTAVGRGDRRFHRVELQERCLRVGIFSVPVAH